MTISKRLPLAVTCLVLVGCSEYGSSQFVKVYKYDGSVQCESNGTSVEEMQRELTDAGMAVECGQKAGDGYAYPAVCGASTGMINVYTIGVEDLSEAESLGFKSTYELPDYQDQRCEANN
jgi:hypothetical protein